jgi:hypothetical protein
MPATWEATFVADCAAPTIDVGDYLALPPCGGGRLGAIALRRDRATSSIRAQTPPESLSAARLCPTPNDQSIEIVSIARGEAILVRPDVIGQRSS